MDTGPEGMVSAVELEASKQERDMLREELQNQHMTVENLRTEIQVSILQIH